MSPEIRRASLMTAAIAACAATTRAQQPGARPAPGFQRWR
jgi:hypothetical protein